MVGWHHRLDGHEFEQALGAGDGQGSLQCCNPWGTSKSGKLCNGHRTGKDQFSFQSQRKAMPKMLKPPHNCIHFTGQQGHDQNTPSQVSIARELRTSRCTSKILRRQEPEVKLPTSVGPQQKQDHSRKKTSTSASLTRLKHLTMWIIANCGKLLEMEIQTTSPAS